MENPEVETSFASLPPELLVKIFNHLTFSDKLKIRRVCKFWHVVVDSHTDYTFRVELNGENTSEFRWVKNLSWTNVEGLKIDELTEELYSEFPGNVQALSIAANNSTLKFWAVLSTRCYVPAVVNHLSLVSLSASDFLLALNFPGGDNKPPKILTIQFNNMDTRGMELKSGLKDESEGNGGGVVLRNVFQLPNVETVSFELDCANSSYPSSLSYIYELLFRNNGVKSLRLKMLNIPPSFHVFQYPTLIADRLPSLQLEKLDLCFDFRLAAHVIGLVEYGNLELKEIRLKHTNESEVDEFTWKGYDRLLKLVHEHSSTLESLYITSHDINFGDLQLSDCVSLRKLKLKSPSIFGFSEFRVPRGLKISSVNSLTLSGLGPWSFDVILSVFSVMGNRLTEFQMDFYEGFRIYHLQAILRLRSIRKIVLAKITGDPRHCPIREYCCQARSIRAVTVTRKVGRVDYQISVY